MRTVCVHTKGHYHEMELPSGAESSKTKPSPNALGGKIWSDDTITWKLISDTPTIPGRNIEEEIFKRVFTQIGLYIPGRITQLKRTTSDADIRINFTKIDPYWNQFPSALAYTWGPGDGLGGDIFFNTKSYIWTPDGKPVKADKAYDMGWISGYENPNNWISTFNAQHTGQHEGQHAVGCNHIAAADCYGAVINPIYNGEMIMKQCEIDQLQKLYGKVNLAQSQIDTVIKRYKEPIPY